MLVGNYNKLVGNSSKFVKNTNLSSFFYVNFIKQYLVRYYCFSLTKLGFIVNFKYNYNNKVCIFSGNKVALSKWRLSRYALKSCRNLLIGINKAEW